MGNLSNAASKQLRQRIQKIECDIVNLISDDDSFLSPDDAASLRWALSLARITKVRTDKSNNEKIYYHFFLYDLKNHI